MGGSKFNQLLGNVYVTKYKNSLAYISSSIRLSNAQKNKYNYLQDSLIPTLHFQKSLTKLKIPKLEDTFDRYLSALKPILNENDWKKAEEITKKFQTSEAILLDKEIRDLDNQDKNSNYISESWFDMYLKARESIVLNYNPFIAFASDPNPNQMNQALRATNFLVAATRFMKSLRANKLKPEIFHLTPEKSDTLLFQRLMRLTPESVSFYAAYMFNAYPLDMSQYFRLFNSTRIPKKGKDILFTDDSKDHILVVHKGNYYVFNVLNEDGSILEPTELLGCFQHILSINQSEAEFSLGSLTSENRDVWAVIREKLESLGNKEALNAIDSAMFCINLDDIDTNDLDVLSQNFLHGNCRNRWFDKNHQLIITKNGNAAINFEHSWGDGVAVLRFFNEIFDDSTKNPQVNQSSQASFSKGNISEYIKRLDFKLDDSVKVAIKSAEVNYAAMQAKVFISNFQNVNYGRDYVKKFSLSPDSIMQSVFQIAFYKCYKRFVATYESASTSAFKFGRTETIRPATMATKHLAEQMLNKKDTNPQEIYEMLRKATSKHNKLVKEGAMGQGFDRHLFAMKYHAENRKKIQLPEFYQSQAYKFINHNVLSTSTLAYPNILTGGFAPVVSDGFGIGYRILDKTLGASVSSYNKEELKLFLSTLEETFERMHNILKQVKLEKK